VFHVVLRGVSEVQRVPSHPLTNEAAAPAARRGRVLVIDDEPAILGILARALRSQHDCVGVSTASEGLARLRGGELFDVILCDLMMPVMSGMDFHVELTRVAPEQAGKVVFLTGGAFTTKMQAFLEGVANDRIEKPFDALTIKAAVNARVG
jgi:CheY-like chemotaxis protein